MIIKPIPCEMEGISIGTVSSVFKIVLWRRFVRATDHERTPARRVADTVARLTGTGNSVSAQKTQPAMLRFREIIDICGEENP